MKLGIVKVWFINVRVAVRLSDGRTIIFKTSDFKRLHEATKKQLENYTLIGKGIGIHWEELDEDISLKWILENGTLVPL